MTGKKKLGRPLTSPEPRENLVGVRLNNTELQALESYCWRYDTSISNVIRDCLMLLSVIPDNPTTPLLSSNKTK
jgi:hypothetical protein